MTSSPSMAGRAALAVALMIGFYLLAFAMVFGLFWLVYAETTYAHRIHLKIAIFCGLGAGAILPQWRQLANATALNGLTPESLPACALDQKSWGKRWVFPSGETVDEDHAANLAGVVIGSALAMLLVTRGATLDAAPGQAISVRLAATSFEPFGVLAALAQGKTTADAWQQQCATLSITGVDLGTIALAKA